MDRYKFRAKAIEEMTDDNQWVYGTGIQFTEAYAKQTGVKEICCLWTKGGWVLIDPATVGQYACETDVNEKEIYGGSILKISPYSDEEYIVAVEERDCAFLIDTPYTSEHDMTVLTWYIREFGKHTVEVIGNIHDNPELLEG